MGGGAHRTPGRVQAHPRGTVGCTFISSHPALIKCVRTVFAPRPFASGTARTETLLAAFARRRGDRDRRGDSLAHARRRRAALVWVVLAAALKQDVARCGASLFLLSPVVVLVSRLLFGRRFVRDGPSPARIATGDARAMHAAHVRHGWFSPPQSSTDVARVVASSPLFFSRFVAPRLALPRSTRMPAGGARITSGRAAHATRDATRAGRGESERRAPSELAVRVLRACGALLLLSSLVPSLRARPSLDPPTRRRGRAHHERARGACNARRDARGAWESERRAPSEFAVRVRGERPSSWASPCSTRATAPSTPLPEAAGGRGVRTTNGHATHAARGAAHAACGDAKGSPLSFVAVRGSRVFSVFRSSPYCAPRCSLGPRLGNALARAGTRRTRDLRAELAPRCVCVCGLFVPRSATWRGGPRARVRLCCCGPKHENRVLFR